MHVYRFSMRQGQACQTGAMNFPIALMAIRGQNPDVHPTTQQSRGQVSVDDRKAGKAAKLPFYKDATNGIGPTMLRPR